MGNIKETQYFQAVQDKKVEVSDVLEQVYIALTAGSRAAFHTRRMGGRI